jgi:phosphoribosylformylglycinamidine synthase PurS subunit
MHLIKIYIRLKPTVNDPQGLTIKGALSHLGFVNIEEIRAGKYLEIRVNEDNIQKVRAQANDMCQKLLANPVIENFSFEVEPA